MLCRYKRNALETARQSGFRRVKVSLGAIKSVVEEVEALLRSYFLSGKLMSGRDLITRLGSLSAL